MDGGLCFVKEGFVAGNDGKPLIKADHSLKARVSWSIWASEAS